MQKEVGELNGKLEGTGDTTKLEADLKTANEQIAELKKEDTKALKKKNSDLEKANKALKEENKKLLTEMEEATS